MTSSSASKSNALQAASLAETKRQYNEQQAEKEDKKARDKANALSNRVGAVEAYEKTKSPHNILATDNSYSLLSMGGTAPVFADLMGGAGMTNTLGG